MDNSTNDHPAVRIDIVRREDVRPSPAVVSAAEAIRDARAALVAAMDRGETIARELDRQGVSAPRIASALGVNRLTVRKWTGKSV